MLHPPLLEKTFINRKNTMKYFIFILLALVNCLSVGVAQQDMDIVRANTVIKVTAKAIPEEDLATISSAYTVASDGTIRMPLLPPNVSVLRVAGMRARQVEDALVRIYVSAGIYNSPTFLVQVDPNLTDVQNSAMFVQVSGNVNRKGSVPYTRGMTLLKALVDSGDITDFGSRFILLTRNGQTKKYDYYSVRDRAIELKPNDEIFIPERDLFERRPNKLLP